MTAETKQSFLENNPFIFLSCLGGFEFSTANIGVALLLVAIISTFVEIPTATWVGNYIFFPKSSSHFYFDVGIIFDVS